MAMARRQIRWFNRWLWCLALGVPLIGLIALPLDPNLVQTRAWTQGLITITAFPSLWILYRLSRQSQMRSMIILSIGFTSVLITGFHDFIWIRLLGDVEHNYWMPWSVPLTLPGFTMMLMSRMVSAFDDIERLNLTLEQKVQERTRQLAAATSAKSQFLAAASHDLRQPVAAIGLITDLLQEKLTDPALKGLTQRLTRAVVSMESLLKGLLDLSRLDSGTVEVLPQQVRLQSLLESITAHESESAQHKGLNLRVRPTQATAWTDPILLEQILRNLVGNAVRHTEKGGILVGVRQRGALLKIQVWDTGAGISERDQARIFDDFVQLDNPGRDRRKGLGLGLAIVKRAARLLNHPIEVRSRRARGSCFSVLVPVSPDAATAISLQSEEKPAPLPDHSKLRGTRIVVVEDDLSVREAMSNHLRSWGCEVTAGPGLRWLVKQPQELTWDLIISDHRLADGTGREAIQFARDRIARLPALIVTGDTSPDQLNLLAQSGLPVLHKPFRAEKLRAMIEATMARR